MDESLRRQGRAFVLLASTGAVLLVWGLMILVGALGGPTVGGVLSMAAACVLLVISFGGRAAFLDHREMRRLTDPDERILVSFTARPLDDAELLDVMAFTDRRIIIKPVSDRARAPSIEMYGSIRELRYEPDGAIVVALGARGWRVESKGGEIAKRIEAVVAEQGGNTRA